MLNAAGPASNDRLPSFYLDSLWSRVIEVWIQFHGGSEDDFNGRFLGPIYDQGERYLELGGEPDEIAGMQQLALSDACGDPALRDDHVAVIDRWLALVCAHAMTSDLYEERGDISASWEAAFLAQSVFGNLLERHDFSRETFTHPDPLRKLSKMGNDKRHRENRAAFDDACRWLDVHFHECDSKDDAADRLAREVVPMKFRTTRRYVDRWFLSKHSPGRG